LLKTTKNTKLFALILLTSMLLLVAISPAMQSVKAATTTDTVTVFASCAGTTTPANNSTGPYATYTYDNNTVHTFTATAGAGFQFLCWVIVAASGPTTSTTNPLSYTLTQPIAIQALFIPTSSTVTPTPTPTTTPSQYSVAVFTSAGGTTTPTGSSTTAPYVSYNYNSGSVQTFTATAGTDFKLLCWLIVGANGGTTSTSSSLSYTVSQDVAIQAFFIPTSSTVTLPTTSPTPTPKVDEFSSATAIIIAAVLVIVAFGTYTYTKKAKK
jgi:hypothetical protein